MMRSHSTCIRESLYLAVSCSTSTAKFASSCPDAPPSVCVDKRDWLRDVHSVCYKNKNQCVFTCTCVCVRKSSCPDAPPGACVDERDWP